MAKVAKEIIFLSVHSSTASMQPFSFIILDTSYFCNREEAKMNAKNILEKKVEEVVN